MKGRLQFLHHEGAFSTRAEAIDWLNGHLVTTLSNVSGGTLPFEPIGVKYTEGGQENVILAIGKDTGATKYHLIDSADIYAKVVDEKVRAMVAETSLSGSIDTLRIDATNSATSLFNKIETDIANLDSRKIGTESGVEVTVDELNGKISDVVVSVKTLDTNDEITTTANEVVSGKGVRDAVDKAKSDLQEQITANKITSEGKTITVVTAATGTNIEVNVDNATLTKDETTTASRGVISSTLKIKSVTPTDPNVKEEFNLIDKNNTVYGDAIKIYKDSALVKAYLGKMDDVVDPDSGIITPGTTGNTALCLLYILFNGKYELAKIDVEVFITKTQFKDGLIVNSNNEVRVQIATDSEAFLTVDANGVKLSGVQNAINTAVLGEKERAVSAETVLTKSIADETEARKDSILVEENRAKAAEAELTSGITTEKLRAEAAESGLTNSIALTKTELEGKIAQEVTDRNKAISDESARAQIAEGKLTSDLSAEVTAVQTLSSATHTMKDNLYADNTNPDSIKHIILTDTMFSSTAAAEPAADQTLLRQSPLGKIYASNNAKDMFYKGANLETTIEGMITSSSASSVDLQALSAKTVQLEADLVTANGKITDLENALTAFSATVKTFIDSIEDTIKTVIAQTVKGTDKEIKVDVLTGTTGDVKIGFADDAVFGPIML